MKALVMCIALFCSCATFGASAGAQWLKTNWPQTPPTSSPGIRRPNIFFGTGGALPASFTSVSADTDTVLVRSTVFALTVHGPNIYAGTYGHGVYLSSDNGGSWTPVNNGLSDGYIHALEFSGATLIAGTDAGVFLSNDNGAHWAQEIDGLSSQVVYAFAAVDSVLFASTSGNGVYKSFDNGLSWTSTGLDSSDVPALAVSGTSLFAGTYGNGIYLSTNYGTTWTAVDSGLTTYNRIQALTVNGTSVFAGTRDGGVFVSTNGGTIWTQADSGLSTPNVYALGSSGSFLFAGTYEGGPFVSNDNAVSWRAVNVGLPNAIVFAFAVSGSELFAGLYGYGVWHISLSGLGKTTQVAVQAVPATIHLDQNYPNPFNPTTTIRYGLGRTSLVSLKIYTMLGQEVATLGYGLQEPGYHEVRFDGSRLASGTYIYRLRAAPSGGAHGELYVETKKLILVR